MKKFDSLSISFDFLIFLCEASMDKLVYVVSLVAQCFFTIEVVVKMVGEGYHPER